MAKERFDGADAKSAASLQTANIKVLEDDENFDHSMMLAIGSTFKCTCTFRGDGTAVMYADSTVIYKRSVVSLMEGIRGACAKVTPEVKKDMELLVRIDSDKEGKGLLWAILDLRALPPSAVLQAKALAQGISQEMYEATSSDVVKKFASEISAFSLEDGDRSSIKERYAAHLSAAAMALPPHLEKLALFHGDPEDAGNMLKTLQTVVTKGRVLGREMSKSTEMENLNLRFGDEELLTKSSMPQRKVADKVTRTLEPQMALLAGVNFANYSLTLLLQEEGGVTCRLGYKDDAHGGTIGEAILQAHHARTANKVVQQVDPSTGLVRVRVGLIEETCGSEPKKYHLETIETV
ncbi:hypothetical protein [Hydrogenophaga sp. 2FB]|uniref:hypothetical protein n=1 Tax=Hydrogenophaga sp. 2FB TaxID=2502187 RepID=UPI0010F7E6B8|nr:hypothetical protein [Hydrogenophaga sp. 2FB]